MKKLDLSHGLTRRDVEEYMERTGRAVTQGPIRRHVENTQLGTFGWIGQVAPHTTSTERFH